MSSIQTATLDGVLASAGDLHASLGSNVVIVGADDIDTYQGAYQVEPEVYAQELPTEGKMMIADLTVNKIRRANVRNSAGGYTCVIGGN